MPPIDNSYLWQELVGAGLGIIALVGAIIWSRKQRRWDPFGVTVACCCVGVIATVVFFIYHQGRINRLQEQRMEQMVAADAGQNSYGFSDVAAISAVKGHFVLDHPRCPWVINVQLRPDGDLVTFVDLADPHQHADPDPRRAVYFQPADIEQRFANECGPLDDE